MKKPPAKIRAILRKAAELRALGLSWEIVAAKLGCSERSLRRWTERYRRWWQRVLYRAQEQALGHVGDKSLSILDRAQMGKGDPNSRLAAQFLYGKQREAKERRRRQRAPVAPALIEKYLPLLSYFESLNESQRRTFREHLLARLQAEHESDGVPGDAGAGPAVAG